MSGFQLSIGTPDDAAAIARGMAGDEESDLRELSWAFGTHPGGFASLVARDGAGNVVAHLGALREPMDVRGELLTFGRLFGCFVNEDHRIGGRHSLLVEMLSAFREEFESKAKLAMVFGRFQEPDFWFLRKIADFQAISTGSTLVRVPSARKRLNSEFVVRADEALLSSILEPPVEGLCQVRRTGDLLRYRIGGPHADAVVLCLVRGQRFRAMAAYRDQGDERLLVDFHVKDGALGDGQALLDAVIEDGQRRVKTWIWNPDRFVLHLLQDAGFVVAPAEETYLAARWAFRGLKQPWLHRHWQVMAMDLGEADQRALTVGETIVSPPPLGTGPDGKLH